MKENILKLVKDKNFGKTGPGEKLYENITESDLNNIISASVMYTVNQIKKKIEIANDEFDTIFLIEHQLTELEEEFGNNKKNKNKIK